MRPTASKKKESNVLRITGGEPFLVPELILECLTSIRDHGLERDVFLWTETNLLPFIGEKGKAFMDGKEEQGILEKLGKFDNFAVHPCFHGLDATEFDDITGSGLSATLDHQLEGIRRLLEAKIKIYPTFGSNVCNPSNISELFRKMIDVDPYLPLTLALVKYDTDYEPIKQRIKGCRPYPRLYSHYSALRIWNQLLLERYGVGYGILPRNLALVNKDHLSEKQLPQDLAGPVSPSDEIIWLFKGSFRDLYHREILDYLAYPYDHIIEITYEKRHIQSDLFLHMSQLPLSYTGRLAIWCYADDPHKTRLPFRLAQICEVSELGGFLTMRLKLKEYVSFNGFGDPDLPGAVRAP